MNTPWGKSESKQTIQPGLYAVQTAGHGGFMLTQSTAQRLTSHGREIGEWFGQYLCFEEDCDYAVLLFEMPDADWNTIFKDKHTAAEWKEMGRNVLARYHPEYFSAGPSLPDRSPKEVLRPQAESVLEGETIDIAPRFSTENAKVLEIAQDDLHNTVRAAAEMLRELFDVFERSPEFRVVVEQALNRHFAESDFDLPSGHPGTGFLTECQEALDRWDEASDVFLAALSRVSSSRSNECQGM